MLSSLTSKLYRKKKNRTATKLLICFMAEMCVSYIAEYWLAMLCPSHRALTPGQSFLCSFYALFCIFYPFFIEKNVSFFIIINPQ